VFLAGATGAIGKRLVPLLLSAGHGVVGTTRSEEKSQALRATGVEPIVVDVFDASALSRAVSNAHADIVIDQLTAATRARRESNRRRNEAERAHPHRGDSESCRCDAPSWRAPPITQSIAWVDAPGAEPHAEDDMLDANAQGSRAVTVAGVLALERLTVSSSPIEGVVLR
jgi:uncharacterized protein YbjT (DUF2867 family)